MATKKHSKSHTSTRKKRPAKTSTSPRAKKTAATKATKSAAKSKHPKPRKETPEQFKKRMELTQQIFDMAYEANQRGEFWRF